MADLIPIRAEMLIGGTWTDVTSATRGSAGIQIQDGSSAEQAYLTAGQAYFTLNNASGTYTDTNPLSPYYGLLGRNTQVRFGLKGTKYVRMLGNSADDGSYDGARPYTLDKNALDITGDIDIRFDGECEDWVGSYGQILAAKWYDSTAQRSWMMFTQQGGDISFASTADGLFTNVYLVAGSFPNQAFATRGRQAIRMTWDVDNGAGQNVFTWYRADTIAGPWTQVAQNTYAGTKTIFSGAAAVEVGGCNNGGGRNSPFPGAVPFIGKIYGFELRNGINGTVVAQMDATAQTRGATTWADAYSNTWVLGGSAVIDDMDYRFWGECAQLPQQWDTSGRDVYSPVQAGDILQRLQVGQRSLGSPMYRNIAQYTKINSTNSVAAAITPYVTGFWPLEDNVGAVKGRDAAIFNSGFSDWDKVPGTQGALTPSNDQAEAYFQSLPVAWTGGTKNTAYFSWVQEWGASNGASYLEMPFLGGTLRLAGMSLTTGAMSLYILRNDGTTWKSYSVGYTGKFTFNAVSVHRVMLTHDTTLGTITVVWNYFVPGDTVIYVGANSVESAPSEVVGKPRAIYARGDYGGRGNLKLGQVITAQTDQIPFVTTDYLASAQAYFGETAFDRFARLMREEGIDYWIRGIGELEGSDLNPAMGFQGINTVLELARECADVVGGVLYSPRDKFGLALRMLSSMTGRDAFAPVLKYGATDGAYHLTGTMKPSKVTSTIRNYVIASRPDGAGTQIAEKTSGPLNTSDPKLGLGGVGLYDTPITRNVANNNYLQAQANWEMGVGTEDALRWPDVEVQLHRAPFLADPTLAGAVRALTLGDPFVIKGMPIGKGGPADIPVLYRGRSETITNMMHTININAVPYGPYQWGQYANTSYQEGAQRRLDSSSTTLTSSAAAGVTSLSFTTSKAESAWSKNTTYDVLISGEQCTVREAGSKGSLAGDLGQFEVNGVSNWVLSGTSALAASTTQKRYGATSARCTVAGAPTMVNMLLNSSANYAPTVVGQSYTVQAWIYSSIAITTNAWTFINWHTAANAYVSTSGSVSNAVSVAANTWTKLTFTATAPATGVKANPGVQVGGSPANGTLFYFDSVELIDPLGTTWPIRVTRAVNGIAKTLPAGSPVRIVQSMRWGRV